MALVKKGTRKINVNGEVFRWVVCPSSEDTPWQSNVIIESVDETDYQILFSFDNEIIQSVTPNTIRDAILKARENGWKDNKSRGKKIYVDVDKIKVRRQAKWKPAYFDQRQILKAGTTANFYFQEFLSEINRKPLLEFIWGNLNLDNDYLKASCTISSISHRTLGEIVEVASFKNEFVFKQPNTEKKIILEDFNNIDTDLWTLDLWLDDFVCSA